MSATLIMTYLLAHGLNFLVALVIFVVGRWLAQRVAAFASKAMGRAKVDETLNRFLSKIIEIALIVFVGIAALAQIGIQTTSLIAVLGAAGLAVGLALQGTLSNFASGVMIILLRPFKAGDVVSVAGHTGKVKSIQIFNTSLLAGDNAEIIIPNGQVLNSSMTNYTAQLNRRIDLVIGISYDDDMKQAKELMEKVVMAHSKVLSDPAPKVAVHELGDSSVNFVVRPWVRTADYWSVRWDLTEQLKNALDEAGITIPYPQRDVHHYHMDK